MGRSILRQFWRIDPWLFAVLVCFTLFAWVSWGKLIDPILDTGAEIEIAARLLEGQVLYRDLHTYYGPLAYFVNALALLVFGHHLEVFYVIGLVLSLTATLLGYRLVRQLTNNCWAALFSIYIIIYCAFNTSALFVPYSYAAAYAIVLCLVAFTFLDRYAQTGRIGWLFVASIASSLAGLSKQEFGVAAIVAVLVGANLCAPKKSLKVKVISSLSVMLLTVGCVFLPFLFLSQQSSWQEISSSLLPVSKARVLIASGMFDVTPARTLRDWLRTFGSLIANYIVIGAAMLIAQGITTHLKIGSKRLNYLAKTSLSVAVALPIFFLSRMQFEPSTTSVAIAVSLIWVGGLATAIFLLLTSRWQSHHSAWKNGLMLRMVLAISLAGFSWYIIHRFGLHPLGDLRWLIPLLVGWFSMCWRSLLREKHAMVLWALFTFSTVLNARFCFSIQYYGIFCITAVLLFFTFLFHLTNWTKLPVWNYALIGLLIGGGMRLEEIAYYRYPISSMYGTIYTTNAELATAYNQTIRYIQDSGARSVLVLPVGNLLNFLTSTHSPSKELVFHPGTFPDADAERKFLTQMQENPPDPIVYVDFLNPALNKGYQTYAEFDPLVDRWITNQHQLVYSSPKIGANDKAWNIRIYR